MAVKKSDREAGLVTIYRSVFGTVKGKEILHDLIEKCGLYKTSYVPRDAQGTAFNEGMRSMIMYVIAKLELKPDDVRDLYSEQKAYLEEEDYGG